ncbi:MAG TPA: hypothetical protein VM681_02420, partial [Candidatus Thermoplasmatota archaeon]|nr:hypothetical protein [Candidatus Thermoplasmatota archaeon]
MTAASPPAQGVIIAADFCPDCGKAAVVRLGNGGPSGRFLCDKALGGCGKEIKVQNRGALDPREVDRVLELARDAQVFRDAETGEPHITFSEGQRETTAPLGSGAVKAWLRRICKQAHGRTAASEAINGAVESLA